MTNHVETSKDMLESVSNMVELESHLLSDRMKIRAECVLEHIESMLLGLELELEDDIQRRNR